MKGCLWVFALHCITFMESRGEVEESYGIPPTGADMSEIARIPTHIEGLDENMPFS